MSSTGFSSSGPQLRAEARLQERFVQIDLLYIDSLRCICRRVPGLAVIDAALDDLRRSRLPALIRRDDLLRAIRIPDMQLRNHRQPVAVILDRLPQTVAPLVPAVSQQDRDRVLALGKLKLEGLVLDPAAVDREARKQALIAHLLAVQIQLIQTQARHVHARPLHALLHMDRLIDAHLQRLVRVRRDEISRPCAALRRLEPGRLAHSTVTIIPLGAHPPEIAGALLQFQWQCVRGRIHVLGHAAVEDGRGKAPVQSHLHPGLRDFLRVRVLTDKRHRRSFHGHAQGIRHMVRFLDV